MTKSRHIINRKCTGHNWTQENAVAVISRYSDLKTFREENSGLYAAIHKNGWLELLTPLQRRFVWTKDAVKQIINKYNTFRQFKQENMAVYSAICRNNWTDLFNRFNDRPVNWTRDLIEKKASKYTKLSEFRKNEPSAYSIAIQYGWSDILSHLEKRITAPRCETWTRERIKELVDKCSTHYEFSHKYPSAHHSVVVHKWYDLTKKLSRVRPNRDNRNRWAVYKWVFPEETAVYIGLTVDLNRRFSSELNSYKASPVKAFIEDTGCTYSFLVIKDSLSCDQAAQLEVTEIEKHKNNGYKVLNRNQGGSLGSYYTISNDDLFNKILKKYKSISELYENDFLSYSKIRQRGLLNELKARFPDPIQIRIDLIKQHIAKCKNLYEFKCLYNADLQYLKYHNMKYLADVLPNDHKPFRSTLSTADRINEIRSHVALCKTDRDFKKKFPKDACFLRNHHIVGITECLPSAAQLEYNKKLESAKIAIGKCDTFVEFSRNYVKDYRFIQAHKLFHLTAGLKKDMTRVRHKR